MTLDEIRVLLRFKDAPQTECGEVDALLDEHIGHVVKRIRELKLLEKQLRALSTQCHGVQDARHCGILNGLAAGISSSGAAQNGRHVPGPHRRTTGRR
jgi:DNA-binding transcriptional MerR regulator